MREGRAANGGAPILLTAIVAVYHIEENLLSRCLDSLTINAPSWLQILLIDDGSADHCPAICDEYAARCACVRAIHTENRGVSAARNSGLDNAVGEWVIFVDGDDYMLDGFWERVPSLVNDQSDCDVIYFKYRNLWDTSGKRERAGGTNARIEVPDSFDLAWSIVANTEFTFGITGVNFGSPWGKFFRRSFIEEHGHRFVLGVKKSQDRVFMVGLLGYRPRVCAVDAEGYAYINNAASTTHRLDPQMPAKLRNTTAVMEQTVRAAYTGAELEKMGEAFGYMRCVFMYNALDSTYLCPFDNPRYRHELAEFTAYVRDFLDSIDRIDVGRIYGARNKFLIHCLKRRRFRLAYFGSILMMDGYLLTRRS